MSTPLITPGFHHITMVARHAPRTLAFYGEVLGLELVKRTVNFDDPGSWHLYFGDEMGSPGTLVTFFEWPDAPQGRWGVGGIHHLALGVDSPEALLKWKRRLVDHGLTPSGPIDRGYFQSLYFTDPDGQVLEIATKGPGYAIDEPADDLGGLEVVPDPARLPGAAERAAFEGRIHPAPVPRITPDMRLGGIHHITGITDDIERAHAFYEEALGLRIVKRTVNQDDGKTKHWFWANYRGAEIGEHSALTLFGWPGSTYRIRPGVGQTHHVAFRAPGDEDLGAWQDHLRSLGVQVTEVRDRQYFRSIYFQAPDGLLLEIATDAPGFALDEDPGELGIDLKLPPWLESRRASIQAGLSPLEDPAALTGGE